MSTTVAARAPGFQLPHRPQAGCAPAQVVQLEANAVAASLLPGLLSYYPVDQFAAAPPLPGTPAGAGLAVEAWAPNKLRAGAPPFAAPTWHLPSEAEARPA